MDAADIELDFDANFEPQIRARSNTWPLRPSRQLDPQNSPVAGDDSSNGGDQQNGAKDPLGLTGKKSGSRRNAWGNLSYADLITKAIQNSPEKRLTLSQIYDWMVQNVPYFKDKGDSTSSAGWKNSIRHNLSLHSRFMRIQNEGTGKSSWWVLNPDAKPGKTPRRRAGSMETKSYEKKRGRIRKKVEALRAGLENGTLSPGGSDDYLDGLNFGDFRPRASSDCSRLSPISAVAEPDLTSSDIQSMSSIPWGSDVSNSPTVYTDNVYSDLVESLVEGMKLSSQDGLKMDMVTGMNGSYISDVSNDYNSQQSSYGSVNQSSPGLDNQYNSHPAQPSYPKQQQPQQQMNGLEFRTQNFNSALQIQIGQSPVNNGSTLSPTNLYNDDFSDSILGIKQEIENLSPVHMATPSSMTGLTHQPACQEQASPSSGPFTPHHSPRPQAGLGNGLNPHGCQMSPQQNRHLIQQQTIAAATLQQQALQQATRDSILREALTRGPSTYRPHTAANTPSPNFSPVLNHAPLACAAVATTISNGLNGFGLAMRPNSSPHHQVLTTNQLHNMGERFTDNHIVTGNNIVCGNGGNLGVPLDIDVDLMGISALDYDMEQVIKQELTLEGNLDFNFDAGPVTSVSRKVVH